MTQRCHRQGKFKLKPSKGRFHDPFNSRKPRCLHWLAACGELVSPCSTRTATDPTEPQIYDDPTDTDGEGGVSTQMAQTPPLPGTDARRPTPAFFATKTATQWRRLVTDVSYDAANDTFTVDNLGFDARTPYQRVDAPAETPWV